MDSDESQDASSGNESERENNCKGPRSPQSVHSESHGSTVSTPDRNRNPRNALSRSHSADSDQDSVQSDRCGPRSPPSDKHSNSSRSPSPGDDRRFSFSRSRSPSYNIKAKTPKSPESTSTLSGPRSPSSPVSRPLSPNEAPRSPSSASNSPAHSASSSKSPKNLNNYKNSHSPLKSPLSNNNDKNSVISDSSQSSKKSKSPSLDRLSGISDKSGSSRASRKGRKSANLDDGNTSDSSESSIDSSSRKNKDISKNVDTQPEEISEGDMESEDEKPSNNENNKKDQTGNINISHEDLSDVSDLDDSISGQTDDEDKEKQAAEAKIAEEEKKIDNGDAKKVPERNNRAEDGEEQLDFEAEDGECGEIDTPKDKDERDKHGSSVKESGEVDDDQKEEKEPDELEEGEVTDEDDVRPEETEPRPVCRFFSRGQCTWGASCRFLHPGVTDKGNYTMFEIIRPVVPGEYGRDERLYGRPDPPPLESAWERGLRTAKEMLRKSIKRKEQDIDFEEKKMNLSLAQEEFDKENGYYTRVPSPEPRYVPVRHAVPMEYAPVARPPPEEYYGRRQVLYEPEYAPPPRERVRSYREVPSHRVPEYYPSSKYEGEPSSQPTAKVRRPKREVIVQRVEERQGRADEWSDPWMRSKSPVGRKGARKRSYTSGSSYSSSSSSRSSSASSRSSYRSRSHSPRHKRSPRHHRNRHVVSPSVIVSERKAANERAALMNPPAPKKKAPSPGMMRAGAQNPPPPTKVDQFGRTRSKLAAALARVKSHHRSSRSSSESSGSSSSDSDSSGSSSSSSRTGSSPRRTAGVDLAMAIKASKAIDALKSGSSEKRQIKLNLKNPVNIRKQDISEIRKAETSSQGKKRPANSPPSADIKGSASKKATSRREELLKQLKAVEDAIAKKRSKV